MTMVPEAWQNDAEMPEHKKDFYRFAASSFEPWDGPALLTFSDGRYVGAILDRYFTSIVFSESSMIMKTITGTACAPPAST